MARLYAYLRAQDIDLQCFVMLTVMKVLICLFVACAPFILSAKSLDARDPILGRWITDRKDLVVEVYLQGSEYRAKIVWVSDNSVSPEKRLDDKNPAPPLRTRKIIGMDVLEGLTYNDEQNCWEHGHIYDATSGKTWSASARLDKDETLVVRGYWGFELFGKTLQFRRYR